MILLCCKLFTIQRIILAIIQVIFVLHMKTKRDMITGLLYKKKIIKKIKFSEVRQFYNQANTNLRQSIFLWDQLMIKKQKIITYMIMAKIIHMKITGINTIK